MEEDVESGQSTHVGRRVRLELPAVKQVKWIALLFCVLNVKRAHCWYLLASPADVTVAGQYIRSPEVPINRNAEVSPPFRPCCPVYQRLLRPVAVALSLRAFLVIIILIAVRIPKLCHACAFSDEIDTFGADGEHFLELLGVRVQGTFIGDAGIIINPP